MAESQKPVIAFDVYGTLIDPYSMEEHLRSIFGEKAKQAAELWREKQIEFSFRRALMRRYVDFNVCTAQALSYVAARLGISLSEQDQRGLLGQYGRLPAYPDAAAGLKQLQQEGYTLVAFSNGTESAVRGLLDRARILDRFSAIISVDKLQTFKPDPAVYAHLAERVQRAKDELWLVSSNPFDVIGGKSFGLRTTWLQRDLSRVYDPWEFVPDLVIRSLEELPASLA